MKIIESVFDISNEFMKDPSYVVLNDDGIKSVAKSIKENSAEDIKANRTQFKEIPNNEKEIYKELIMQLAAGAINYCYWYGKSNIRPMECSSTKMFDILERYEDLIFYDDTGRSFQSAFFHYIKKDFARERFPLLEERIKHLDEVVVGANFFVLKIMENIKNSDPTFEELFEELITKFPGYGSDIFLKRASLFFIILNRIFGWHEDKMNILPVPADYQVPKMLEYYNCIQYSEDLVEIISNNELIPKGSQIECEIRAATILACKELCKLTNLNTAEIDYWFWSKRKVCENPFHLTITTDY